MKIGVYCPYNIAIPGGVQAHVQGQIAELRRRGHEVTLITPRPAGYIKDPEEGTVFVGRSTRVKAQQTWADVSSTVDSDVIDRLLETSKFDVLHVHEPLIPFLAGQILSRAKCPTVGTFHATVPDTFLAKAVAGSIGPHKKGILKYLTAVTAVSPAATSFLEDLVPKNRIAIIPNAIDVTKFVSGTRPRDPNMILYVGRLEKRKGVKYLVQAFKELRETRPEANLVIAGDGPERESLESKVKSLKLGNHVKFLGQITEEQKVELLNRCAVFTSPALYGESFGIVLLEAAAAGAVTVAGMNPGYESVLTGGGRLSLVDPKSKWEYSRRLDLLMSVPALQAVWRAWGHDRVKSFTYPQVVSAYEKLYEHLLGVRA